MKARRGSVDVALGMAAALLALAGESDRYEKDLDALGKSWKQSRESVMKEGQESASGATGKVYYVALTRPGSERQCETKRNACGRRGAFCWRRLARSSGSDRMRLICHRFQSNEVRPCLSVIAYNQGNLWRRLVLPKRIGHWSLSSLQQWLVKDRRAADQTRALLLAFKAEDIRVGGCSVAAENDRGVARCRTVKRTRAESKERLEAIERRSVSGEERVGRAKARTTASQNGQNEPHYHARGQGDLRLT